MFKVFFVSSIHEMSCFRGTFFLFLQGGEERRKKKEDRLTKGWFFLGHLPERWSTFIEDSPARSVS